MVLRSDQDAFIFQTMRSTESKNQNKQLPSQVEADQPKVNSEIVEFAIQRLNRYDDVYARAIVLVFRNYLKHQDFKTMRAELDLVPPSNRAFHKIWDFTTKDVFLEVIYP